MIVQYGKFRRLQDDEPNIFIIEQKSKIVDCEFHIINEQEKAQIRLFKRLGYQ